MFHHYLTTALRQVRRHTLTTAINIVCLSMGLVCFVIAYAAVIYLQASERAFPNADRTFVISSNRLRDDNTVAVAIPATPGLLAKYLRADVPELEAVARATGGPLGAPQGYILTAGDRTASVYAAFVDPEFLTIFDLPFLFGDPRGALYRPDSAVLTGRSVASRAPEVAPHQIDVCQLFPALAVGHEPDWSDAFPGCRGYVNEHGGQRRRP